MLRAYSAVDRSPRVPTDAERAAHLEMARRVLSGATPDPCPANTLHWGGPTLATDSERAAKAIREGRWALAKCTRRTANRFYVVRGVR